MATIFKQGKLFNGGKRSLRITGDGHSEHQHQVALVSWARNSARLQTDELKRLALEWFHAIPNGTFLGQEDKDARSRYGLKLIAEGLTPGVWDLRLDLVLRDSSDAIICPGLIIEMKLPKNYLSDKQIEYGEFMERQGFKRFVARNWQDGASGIISYMGLEKHAAIYTGK
jgi:hypothetical protein